MSNHEITTYDVMFSARTGVTIMIAKQKSFDVGEKNLSFSAKDQNIIITGPDGSVTLPHMQENHINEACTRGFIMFYECEDDEVTRCTCCNIQK